MQDLRWSHPNPTPLTPTENDPSRHQMLWNWYTIDSCFIAESWHVRSRGAFAGTCIGVILLVISLELVRRAHREYDAWIFRQWRLANSSNISSRGLHAGTGDHSESDSPAPKGRFEDPSVRALVDAGARGPGGCAFARRWCSRP